MMWDLDKALVIIRALQPITRNYGYHLSVGGGVVNNGESDKDLDLYFLPMGGFEPEKTKTNPDGLLMYLVDIWGEYKEIGEEYGYGKRNKDCVYKYAVKFVRENNERIDCFIF